MSGMPSAGRRTLMRAMRTAAPRVAAEVSWRRALADDRSLAVVRQLVRPGDAVADIGASRGIFTAKLERLVGAVGHVTAFEPNPKSLVELRRVAGRRTRIHPVALSDTSGTALLHVPVRGDESDEGLGSLQRPIEKRDWRTETVEVRTTRLDDVLAGAHLDFVKCDVEGHEHSVLLGALAVFERDGPALFVELEQRHRDEPIASTFALLADLGYTGWALFADGARPLDAFVVERDQRSAGSGFETAAEYVHNFVFTRKVWPWASRSRRAT